MPRSLRKGPFVDLSLSRKIEKYRKEGIRSPIRTWSRRSMITPEMIGLSFEVHNGKKFFLVFVSENMIGHKFGEFSPTRIHRKLGSPQAKKGVSKKK